MNQPSKSTYQTDLVLQGIVYFPMIISYVLFLFSPGFAILGMLAQFGVGCVQVASGVYHTLQYQDEVHKKYLTGAISYVIFLFLITAWINTVGSIIFVFLFVIPVIIATWYYRLTWMLHKNANNLISFDSKGKFDNNDDDILDDVMLQ